MYGESRRIFVCPVGMLAAPRGGTTGSNYHVTKLSLECNFVIVCWPRVHPSAAKVSDFVRILRIFDLANLPRTDYPPIAITPDS